MAACALTEGERQGAMPTYLKLIARFANIGVIGFLALGAFAVHAKDKPGGALLLFAIAVLLGFNLYLVEKSAMLLSEEEWLKSEVRKVFLRRKLRRLAEEEGGED